MSALKTPNHLSFNFYMEFIKDLSLVLCYSYCTLLLSVLSYLTLQETITSMLMMLNFSYHSRLLISLKTSLTSKTPLLMYPTGCHPTSLLLILLKQSFLSLVYLNNFLNSIFPPFTCLTMLFSHLLILLVILVLSLIQVCHLLNISLLFLNNVSTIFGI